jgi:pimeloyl-ACP methyl ester carboxylesterase
VSRRRSARPAWWLRAGAAGLAVAGLGVAVARPEYVLEAEFARQRWLAGASETTFQVAGHRWAAVQAGPADAPLVLLVHGFTGSKENWLPMTRELARGHRVLAVDLPGWGDSERLAGGDYGPSAQAARLAEFIAALPQSPQLVVGHSMGGQIVGLMAARNPGIAPRLVLMSAAGVRFDENAFASAVLAGENPFQVTNRAELKRYLGIVFAEPPFVPWPASAALVSRRRADAEFEQRVLDGIGRGPEAFALEEELGAITAPSLLLWCRDDRVIDASAADVFAAGLRDSRTVLLNGCGHMPMMAQPRQVADTLAGFLR